jgi:tRNA dimethylallyltransferase
MQQAPIVAVVGPTAAGKSDLAIDMAIRLGGEVVNADSMQIYRGMDIGTAKVPPESRRGVTHHLLDVLDVTEPATVAEIQQMARSAMADCRERGVVPIVVGGSALYIRAILDRFEFPGTDDALRTRLEAELERYGAAHMYTRLAGRDPAAAEVILPSNGRRIVRALEVIELTGRPYAASLPPRRYAFDTIVQVGVDVSRPVLDQRIEQRVHAMWEAGLVAEVRTLREQGLAEGRTASRALGYAQVLAFLAGECTEDDARVETIRATRRFARRQDSWFRKDERIRWIPFDDPNRVGRALDQVSAAVDGVTHGVNRR